MMYYIESESNDPRFNLALEQYVFDVLNRRHSYFMLWQNDSSIIIGKHQNTVAEINQEFVEKHKIRVVRRLSGGGAVYHDMGNINFTFITDKDSELFDFSKFCQPVVKALGSIGVKAAINGRNDMEIGGRKFSGNSQYAREGRIMHHGTMMFDSRLEMLEKALAVSEDKIRSKGHQSVKSRVTNIRPYLRQDMDTKQFFQVIRDFMFRENQMIPYELTEEEINQIKKIQKERYDTWEWNYGFSPDYEIEKKRRMEGCGNIEIHMNIKDGIICDLAFTGDYFSNLDSRGLASYLKGSKLEKTELETRLYAVAVEDYFHNLSKEQLIGLLIH